MPGHYEKKDKLTSKQREQQEQGASGQQHRWQSAGRRGEQPFYKTTKGQIMLLMTLGTIATGIGIAAYQSANLKPENPEEKKKDLLRYNGGTVPQVKHCTFYHALDKTPIKEKITPSSENYSELELRKRVSAKIFIDYVLLKFFPEVTEIKSLIVDYFVNQCNDQLVYFLNTPVRLLLISKIDQASNKREEGRYESGINTIKLLIPLKQKIVSSPASPFPYDKDLRFLRHEDFHAVEMALSSGTDCDPRTRYKEIADGKYPIKSIYPDDLKKWMNY